MDVNFFVTCLGDVVKSKMSRDCVLLLEKLGCQVHFPEKQMCCGQPALNSGYIHQTIPAIKSFIKTMEENDYPIIVPAGSCAYAIKNYPTYLINEPDWASRALTVSNRVHELTSFIVNKLHVVNVGASLYGRAVYHPSCSLFRKMEIRNEPITLLHHIKGLDLITFKNMETCCGFGGLFSVRMADISGEMVKEKAHHIMNVNPDYLIGADVSCLLNIGGKLSREGSKIKVMHIAEALMSS